MSKLTKSFKGQISRETEKAIEISVIDKDEMYNTWIPKSALDMKEMKEDYLTVTGFQTFHIKQWFVDSKAKEEETKTEFLGKADQITTEAPKPAPKTTVVDMPFNPNAVESEFVYHCEFDIPTLRKMHAKQVKGEIRGHIENLIESKKLQDIGMETNRILRMMMEGKGK